MKNSNYIPKFKSIFKEELLDFINYKRSIGYIYDKNKCSIFVILDTFFYNIKLNSKIITLEHIEEWLKLSELLSIDTRKHYYMIIKMFTEFLVMRKYDNIMVPMINPYRGKNNFIPYIYTKEEIKNIFEKSKKYEHLYVALHLFYNCGLRISEVVNLKLKHLNEIDKTILIEHSKNDRTRLIPLTDKIFEIIINYIKTKNLNSNEMYIFENDKSRYTINNDYLRKTFHEIQKEIGMTKRENNQYPRVHDLRHTFAVHALEQMQNKDFDLYTTLPILSVYLGHKSIVETEHYLRFVPEYSKKVLTSKEYITNLYVDKELYHE